uniref:Jumping translocation breakpoint protein n=1 Tax=Steinernema glaseri TaxID=37863 RepID=A0A1I7ZZL5_9BILA
MIEKCSPRRMVSLGVGILFLTTVIFVLEEYVEESEADAYVMKGRTDWGNTVSERAKNEVQPQKGVQLNRDLLDAECYLVETVAPLELCVECSAFERNAIKAAHCLPTGFYDKLNCTTSGKLGLRPCFSKGDYAKNRFHIFFALMVLIAGASYAAVSWRQGVLDGHHYTRLQNFLN